MRPATSKWTLELPESRESLEEELEKQESLLDHIHEGLTKNKHSGLEERFGGWCGCFVGLEGGYA